MAIKPGWGRGLLVVEHRAEIAHIKPAYKESEIAAWQGTSVELRLECFVSY
jgi:hypothetical protein